MEALNSILKSIGDATAKAGRDSPPLLIAVSKFQSIDKILELYRQGQRVFGENYVQELLSKHQALSGLNIHDIEFHFIGKLQSNKVKQLLPVVKTIHSVDSLKLVDEIEKRALELVVKPEVYFQINIDDEETKGGFRVSDLEELSIRVRACRNLIPCGLMAIPDPGQSPENAFSKMRNLSLKYGSDLGQGLSIGMSGDFELAITFGATAIRIGTALFGPRTI